MHDTATLKIQDYALIGDCRSAALIGRNGSLDWLCWPRFDSPAIFTCLLDRERGGHWSISPVTPHRTTRRYIEHTNILQTEFHSAGGTAILTDLMPVASEEHKHKVLVPDHEVLRQVECRDGEVELAMEFWPRAYYGRDEVKVRDRGKLGLAIELGRGVYWLRSTHAMKIMDAAASAHITLRAGERAQFSLSYSEDAPAVLCCLGDAAANSIARSQHWWAQWAERAKYEGPYREAVLRSALVLKLLSYAPSGAIIAAPTTSLPERIGGDLNWDYRYCWLRDASLTVRALLGLGYWDEAAAFLSWTLHATRITAPELRILYTVFGQHAPPERELEWLRGYRESRPVRISNGARNQLQLDVYGEVVDAAAQFAFHGHDFDRVTQKVLVEIGKYVAKNWRQPDEGIWEPRSGRKDHTHSRLLCWTAIDRLCTLAKDGKLRNAPTQQWAAAREEIRCEIRERGWSPKLHSYTKTLGGEKLDASLLLLAWYGFEDSGGERMRATYDAIERELSAGASLLYRYKGDDPEGAFGVCSFWAAEYLALGGGTLAQARAYFERALGYGNDVGLFAEEIEAATGAALGNFPQAFTHLGVINAALSIQDRERGTTQLAHRDTEQHEREVHA